MSVFGRSVEKARHWTACWRSRPWRGRFRSQSAWSGRKGCVLKTTSRASTPRLRSACTFVHPTPARLTGQCVTRRAIGREVSSGQVSEARKEEADLVPALDLAAVAATEVGVDGLTVVRTADVGDLGAAVDLGASGAFRDRREGIVDLPELATGLGRIRQGPAAVGAVQRPHLRRRLRAFDRDLDLEVGRRARASARGVLAPTAR